MKNKKETILTIQYPLVSFHYIDVCLREQNWCLKIGKTIELHSIINFLDRPSFNSFQKLIDLNNFQLELGALQYYI